MAGAQQFQEVQPALGAGRAEPGEMIIADLRAEAVRRLVARARIVDRNPGGRLQARAQYVARLAEEAVLAAINSRTTCRLETSMPIAPSSVTSRGTVTWP